MAKDKTEVGSPMNFRGMIYKPINEQGVIYLFSLVSEDLNIRVESIQAGYPDCTGLKFKGNGRWERVRIEFEYKASNFIAHKHEPEGCDIIVCWTDDLTDLQRNIITSSGIEIIALSDRINTDEIPNETLPDPEERSKKEFTLQDHFNRANANDEVKRLFHKLDTEVKKINPDIWDKYSKLYTTYYSPDKMFMSISLRKSCIVVEVFTDEKNLMGFKNTPFHENWGKSTIRTEEDLMKIVPSIKQSFSLMKQAEKEGKKTGWYAITPPEKMTWLNSEENDIMDAIEEGQDEDYDETEH